MFALAGCATQAPAPTGGGYPTTIVAVSNSIMTGFDSEPGWADSSWLENSWVTGTDEEVDSIYSRLAAVNPAAAGQATNLADPGSDAHALKSQLTAAFGLSTPPDIVFLHAGGGADLKCDGSDDENLPRFATLVADTDRQIHDAAPDALIVWLGYWTTIADQTAAAAQRDPSYLEGTTVCDVADPGTGVVDPARVEKLQALIDSYGKAIADACAEFENCVDVTEAVQSVGFAPEDFSEDLGHPSISGLHKIAEAVWNQLFPQG